MHRDDVEAADLVDDYRNDPDNQARKKGSGAKASKGDDRWPTWVWQTYLYSDGSHIAIASDNLMTCLREAGTKIPTGRGQETFKRATQTALLIQSEFCDLFVNGKRIPIDKIMAMKDEPFAHQSEAVNKHGFRLFVKRAKVGQAKHVRVRPRFDEWVTKFKLETLTDEFSKPLLEKLFGIAGSRIGLGDWRPSSPKSPGPFGTFKAKLKF